MPKLALDQVHGDALAGELDGVRVTELVGSEAAADTGLTSESAQFSPAGKVEQARIPTERLVRYALDETDPRGRHKARVFASALGIRSTDWRIPPRSDPRGVAPRRCQSDSDHAVGVAYEVLVMIDDLNGATGPVVTTWIVQGATAPRLTSAWVDIP